MIGSSHLTRALIHEEGLLSDIGDPDRTGIDFAPLPGHSERLGSAVRSRRPDLPGLSEPEVVRHYVRLSRMNYAIDIGLFPLGSCTMKHNPRINEKIARLPGFADIHPLQPDWSVQGALAVMAELSDWLVRLTDMAGVCLTPRAGAQGEFCGMLAIRRALEATGQIGRDLVLIPDSAHGTNPATATQCGFAVGQLGTGANGRVDIGDLRRILDARGDSLAAVMITNPNTCGLLESGMKTIADMVHDTGGYVYCDGANFNALVGRIAPGRLGVDAMHINLHKTFSTPHGGGGPGSGPTVFSEALLPFAPYPRLVEENGQYRLDDDLDDAPDRLGSFHGQGGTFVRALSYILSLGADGLRQTSGDAVLAANYLLARLGEHLSAPFDGYCMHEAVFSDAWLEGSGLTTTDIAKALIDFGFHPMTMYFPLSVPGAMLIEPTETEPRRELDRFIDALIVIAGCIRDKDAVSDAPILAPRRRVDETAAARNPLLVWTELNQTANR